MGTYCPSPLAHLHQRNSLHSHVCEEQAIRQNSEPAVLKRHNTQPDRFHDGCRFGISFFSPIPVQRKPCQQTLRPGKPLSIRWDRPNDPPVARVPSMPVAEPRARRPSIAPGIFDRESLTMFPPCFSMIGGNASSPSAHIFLYRTMMYPKEWPRISRLFVYGSFQMWSHSPRFRCFRCHQYCPPVELSKRSAVPVRNGCS